MDENPDIGILPVKARWEAILASCRFQLYRGKEFLPTCLPEATWFVAFPSFSFYVNIILSCKITFSFLACGLISIRTKSVGKSFSLTPSLYSQRQMFKEIFLMSSAILLLGRANQVTISEKIKLHMLGITVYIDMIKLDIAYLNYFSL